MPNAPYQWTLSQPSQIIAPFIKILSNNVVKRLTVLMPTTKSGRGQFYFEGNDRATLSTIANGFGQSRAVERIHSRSCQTLSTPTACIRCHLAALRRECWGDYRGDARK